MRRNRIDTALLICACIVMAAAVHASPDAEEFVLGSERTTICP